METQSGLLTLLEACPSHVVPLVHTLNASLKASLPSLVEGTNAGTIAQLETLLSLIIALASRSNLTNDERDELNTFAQEVAFPLLLKRELADSAVLRLAVSALTAAGATDFSLGLQILDRVTVSVNCHSYESLNDGCNENRTLATPLALEMLEKLIQRLTERRVDMISDAYGASDVQRAFDQILSDVIPLIASDNSSTRMRTISGVIPVALNFAISCCSERNSEILRKWTLAIWTQIKNIRSFEKSAAKKDLITLLARIIEPLLLLTSIPNHPIDHHPLVDVRCQPEFWEIVQEGLASDEGARRKLGLYILKTVVRHTRLHYTSTGSSIQWNDIDRGSENDQPEQTGENSAGRVDVGWSKYFQWTPQHSTEYQKIWEEFYFLYDIMLENSVHLVEPAIPRLASLVAPKPSTPSLHSSWWSLLLHRGFVNEIASVRRRVVEYIVGSVDDNVEMARVLGKQMDFIFGPLLDVIGTNLSLYSVPGVGTFVSVFGESVTRFFECIILSFEDAPMRNNFVQHLLKSVMTGSTLHYLPAMYIMQAIYHCSSSHIGEELSCSPKPFTEEEVAMLENLNTPRLMRNTRVHILLCRFMLSALVAFCNPRDISFDLLSSVLSNLIEHEFPKVQTREYLILRKWLLGSQDSNNYIVNCIASMLSGYLHSNSAERSIGNSRNKGTAAHEFARQANSIARMSIFLLSDPPSVLRGIFAPVCEMMENVWTRAYVAEEIKIRLCVLVGELVGEWKRAGILDRDMFLPIDSWSFNIIRYLELQILAPAIDEMPSDVTTTTLYIMVMERILEIQPTDVQIRRRDEDVLMQLAEQSCTVLRHASEHPEAENTLRSELLKVNALSMLVLVFKILNQRESHLVAEPDDEMFALVLGQAARRPVLGGSMDWNTIVAVFDPAKWNCVCEMAKYTLSSALPVAFDPNIVLARIAGAIEDCTFEDGTAMFDCLKSLVQLPWEKDISMLSQCLTTGILLVRTNKSNSRWFTSLANSFIDFAFSPKVLEILNLNVAKGPIKTVFSSILELGTVKPHIVTRMATALYEYWKSRSTDPVVMQHLGMWKGEIFKLITWGPLRDREEVKFEGAFAMKVENTKDEETVEFEDGTSAVIFSQSDYVVRVLASLLIIHMNLKDGSHERVFGLELLDCIMHEIETNPVFKKNPIYPNQLEHRQKLRSWIAVLLLTPSFNASTAKNYIRRFFKNLDAEINRSVRSYIEWIIVRTLIYFPENMPVFWNELSQLVSSSSKAHTVISLITISFSIGEKLHRDVQRGYYEQAFAALSPWLTSNHYTVRVYAQLSFLRSWNYCKSQSHLSHLTLDSATAGLAEYLERNPDSKKCLEKNRKNYFVNGFDPIEDWNIEFVFRTLMSIGGVAPNERIAARAFEKLEPVESNAIPFRNLSRPFTWSDDEMVIETEKSKATMPDVLDSEERSDVLQKKIEPWELLKEADMDLSQGLSIRQQRQRSDLIVVASLVEKTPNIGGLCRTCEIFNASQLIVNSLKVQEEESFKALSMYSDQWLPISEVQEKDVHAYLIAKKEEGYTLLGLEQTTSSRNLTEYIFPSKSVLLLGREKVGIPPQLLHILDQTLEIPQYGITRSLNVHVSGALAIYEFTKQNAVRR